jgi:hypothetical protein
MQLAAMQASGLEIHKQVILQEQRMVFSIPEAFKKVSEPPGWWQGPGVSVFGRLRQEDLEF